MKSIPVSKKMWKMLHELRKDSNFRNINSMLEWIIDELERYQNQEENKEVKK